MASAPNSINYSNQLPLGIEAKSQRRLFFPSTGDSYSGDGSSIIRISLNYDGMLDTSLSYLKFDFTAGNVGADQGVVRDLGQPEIARLVVSSGGVVLEDIQNYNQLVGSILVPAQANRGVVNAEICNRNALAGFFGGTAGVDGKTATIRPSGGASPGALKYESFNKLNTLQGTANSVNISVNSGAKFSVCYKLISGLLDNDKYLPLVLMNNGIDIEIHLESGIRTCASSNNPTTYTVSNVRYVAHLVDLQRDFYDMLRMTQQQSGGVIQIAGQTYRHFSNTVPATAKGEVNFNVPVRARSIKSIFFCGATQTAGAKTFDLSTTSNMNLLSYQVQIGATKYPPTAIQCNMVNGAQKTEAYFELMKSFGKLGSNIHDNLLCGENYARVSKVSDVGGGIKLSFAPYGIDLETFRAELENGIDTSSRALPMTLLLNFDSTAGSSADILTLHTYALIDSLFFVNMDGSVSVSA